MIRNKIINVETKQLHEIDSIEKYDNEIVFFTKDKKCFPHSKVEFYSKSFLSLCLWKILKKRIPSPNQEFLLKEELKNLEFVKFNQTNLFEYLEKNLI